MIYAVGDVHGMTGELRRVLALVRADAAGQGVGRPRVVFLGDYVDRGPDSKGVLDLLSSPELAAEFDPVFLLGNHELAMLDALRGNDDCLDWLRYGGAECVESYGVRLTSSPARFLAGFREAVPAGHLRFLERLHLNHRRGPWLFSHAGANPHRALGRHTYADWVHGHRAFLDWPEPLEDGVRVVHGHWAEPAVAIRPHRIGVDTGCGMRGRLSAVALADDGLAARPVDG